MQFYFGGKKEGDSNGTHRGREEEGLGVGAGGGYIKIPD